jgi:hypothetical protein
VQALTEAAQQALARTLFLRGQKNLKRKSSAELKTRIKRTAQRKIQHRLIQSSLQRIQTIAAQKRAMLLRPANPELHQA